MNQLSLKPYLDRPELLRIADDQAFRAVCMDALSEFDFMFDRGLYAEGFGSGVSGTKDGVFAVTIVDGEKAGQVMFSPQFPRELILLGRVLAEEHVTRTFARIADSILADMLIRREAYSSIWKSFGEFAVFARQYALQKNRQFETLEPVKSERALDYDSDQVNAFRSVFASKVAHGEIEPLRSSEIAESGLTFFKRHYGLDEAGLINGLLHRFGSNLWFQCNRSVSEESPYQFTLGYGRAKKKELYLGKIIGVVIQEYGIAQSPALAPDLCGWTPT